MNIHGGRAGLSGMMIGDQRNRGRQVAAFRKAQQDSREQELVRIRDQAGRDRDHAPGRQAVDHHPAAGDAVRQPTGKGAANGIAPQEERPDCAESDI